MGDGPTSILSNVQFLNASFITFCFANTSTHLTSHISIYTIVEMTIFFNWAITTKDNLQRYYLEPLDIIGLGLCFSRHTMDIDKQTCNEYMG